MRAIDFITERSNLYHTTTRKGISGMLKTGYILPSNPTIQHGWGFGATGIDDGAISMTRDPRYWAFDFADTQIILDSEALRHHHKVTPYGSHEEFEERVTKPIPFTNVYVKKVIFVGDRPGPYTLKKLKELKIPYVTKYPEEPVDQYKMYKDNVTESTGDRPDDPASSDEFVSNKYLVKFTPTEVLFYKGGELVYRRLGNYTNPSRADVYSAKAFTTTLWEKDKQGLIPNLTFHETETQLVNKLRELDSLVRNAEWGSYEKRKYSKKYKEAAAKLKIFRSTQGPWKKKDEGAAHEG